MSYRSSRARRDFDAQMRSAMEELRPLYHVAQRNQGGAKLLAVYYVFAYARFEVYFRTLVEDLIDAVNTASPTMEKWPNMMLGYYLHKSEKLGKSYQKFNQDEDEKAILLSVASMARRLASWHSGTGYPTTAYASDFLDRRSYPSPKNIPTLFGRLGVENIWAVVDRKGRMDCKKVLSSLNDLRTAIAHEGAVPPDFTKTDFKDRLNQMQRLISAFDRGVSGHFCEALFKRMTWNATMTARL